MLAVVLTAAAFILAATLGFMARGR